MSQVSDRVLSWLWSVLQTYSQPRVAYNDAAAALNQFTTLKPKTAVFTFETGQTALLLCLFGTISVDFRGAEYRYPVEVWVPQNYGERGAGVMCFVRTHVGAKDQSPEMVIRPGQHVAHDGRFYHPYLRDWNVHERCTIVGFLHVARDVFSREPPLAARNGPPATSAAPRGSTVPSLPPKLKPGETSAPAPPSQHSTSGPPPLPAKPGQSVSTPSRASPIASGSDPARGPPLPPLPPGVQVHQQSQQSRYAMNGSPGSTRTQSAHNHGPPASGSALPHRFQSQQGPHSPVLPVTPPTHGNDPSRRYDMQSSHEPQYNTYPQRPAQPQFQQHPSQQPHPQYQQHAPYTPSQAGPPPTGYANQGQPSPQRPLQAQTPAKPAAPSVDLLTDPFDISLPTATPTGPAPPIPPNPQKEHLLHLLSETLVSQANQKIQQAQAALTPLTSQHHALLAAQSRLQSELAQLQSLDTALATNEAILHQSLRDCTAVLEASAALPQPNIDEVLVAPTVAAQQLWNLCADEVAIKEAMYCLQRAVGAGRITSAEFVRLTRSLARECFLKMALARKVATGLGLDVQGYVRR